MQWVLFHKRARACRGSGDITRPTAAAQGMTVKRRLNDADAKAEVCYVLGSVLNPRLASSTWLMYSGMS